jgi:tripeptide aminopeptidase
VKILGERESNVVKTFMELVAIDSESFAERKMADYISDRLRTAGWRCEEDDAGTKIGGNAGNIYACLPGYQNSDGLVMIAHMDRVKPGNQVKASIRDGLIVSDGTTVLGADDAVGIAVMLEIADYIKQNNCFTSLELVFTVAEEVGIKGAKYFDMDKIHARHGYTFDADGPVGTAVVAAPTHVQFVANVVGKAAHAGIAPEKGINAIKIVSHAIAEMKIGRVSDFTTSNVGTVAGGVATNIIPAGVEIKGEVRSHNEHELEENLAHIMEQLDKACRRFDGHFTMERETAYLSFKMDDNSETVRLFHEACRCEEIAFRTAWSGGGSDANIFNAHGKEILNLGSAFQKIHSVDECMAISDLENLYRIALRLVLMQMER